MRLEGQLVDLVPYGKRFQRRDHTWWNGPASFFWTRGDYWIMARPQIEAVHDEIAEDYLRRDPRMMFGIQTKDGTPIGVISFCSVHSHHRLAMLAVMIGEPAYWSGGHGTDALLLMVDFAFDWLDMHKLWLETMGINLRAQRLAEKLGFSLEGRRRAALVADGAPCDELIYGLLRDEWPGRAALVEKFGVKGI